MKLKSKLATLTCALSLVAASTVSVAIINLDAKIRDISSAHSDF